MDNQFICKSIAIVGLLIMFAFQSFYLNDLGPIYSPLIWFVGALLIGFSLDKCYFSRSLSKGFVELSSGKIWFLLLYILGLAVLVFLLNQLFLEHPILASQSDIVPSLEYYVTRLLEGEKVYQAMPFDGYEVWPTYFPMMWLPYIMPELLGFDYRWIPIVLFFSIYFLLMWNTVSQKDSLGAILFKALLPIIFILLIAGEDYSVFAYAVELTPISYYILLIWALYRKNLIWIGIAVAFCTMARYAYSLWGIILVVVLWKEMGFKSLLTVASAGIMTILLVYILPFFIWDPTILTDGLKYYGLTADGQWQLQYWQSDGDIPYHLNRGLSFSYWWYIWAGDEWEVSLSFAKRIQLIMSIATVVGLLVYYFKKKKSLPWNDFLLWSLFVYLAVFYAFIYVPFSYLFMLPLLVGLCLVALFFFTKKEVSDVRIS